MKGKIIKKKGKYHATDLSGQVLLSSPTMNHLKLNLPSILRPFLPQNIIAVKYTSESWELGEAVFDYEKSRFQWDSANTWRFAVE